MYVANDSAAQPGTALNNSVSFRWDIDGDGVNDGADDGVTQATAPDVTVAAPELQLQKSVIEIPGETGDSITYQFDISHSEGSSASAYDVAFTDPLPAGLSSLVIESAVDGTGNPVSGFVLNGNNLEHASFDLLHGESVTLTVSGIISNAVEAGDTVVNTATIVWSSLDASNPVSYTHLTLPTIYSV